MLRTNDVRFLNCHTFLPCAINFSYNYFIMNSNTSQPIFPFYSFILFPKIHIDKPYNLKYTGTVNIK